MGSYSLRDENRKHKVYDWFRFFAPRFILLTLTVGFITRIALLFIPPTVIHFSLVEWLKIFGLGVVNDAAFAVLALAPAVLIQAALNDGKYKKPLSIILLVILGAFLVYSFLPNNVFKQYGSSLPEIAKILSLTLLFCFVIRLIVPEIRKGWRKTGLIALMLLYVFLIVLNALSECFFWYEFGVRYNFIAVDYLVYTNEVIGNIMESYPIVPLFLGVLLTAVIISWRMFRRHDFRESGNEGLAGYLVTLIVYAIFLAGSVYWLRFSYRNLQCENTYATELQCNGCWNFLEAYSSSTLEYDKFYSMLPENEAKAEKLLLCHQDSDGIQRIRDSVPPVKKNIILVTVESLSADFLTEYGNTDSLTPHLDSLMKESLVFDNLYAAGNRSVRGLEALTLCIPPSAGESIVKRPDNGGLFSTGKVLTDLGYTTEFIYGGESYFDNMSAYFSGNGFEIIDKNSFSADDITFSNIWGTCDEDSFGVALRDFDKKAASGEPFHAIVFTISNHRPYTFPEGKITFDGEMKSRKAAVKYTDYAIGQFLKEASGKPWFSNTVFIITADHCASSAGKTSIPVDRYHIPAIVYSPGFITPGKVEKVCSQIDLMPTVFSLLHFSYDSEFYGQNILAPGYRQRAFMATYQDLGFFSDGVLTTLSPVRRTEQFDVTQTEPWVHSETPKETPADSLVREARVYYQSVNLGY